jgi:hypothetical protein
MKCGLCEQKKAKRFCPAKSASICALCCGTKRVFEISCPESCNYLQLGRKREIEDYQKRIQKMDFANREKYRRVISQHQDVIAHLEYTISQERLLARDLTDKEAAQTVDILLDTYRTEDKGILYEKISEDLRIEPLRQGLRKIIESYRNPEGTERKGVVDPKNSRLPLGGAIECLEFIRTLIDIYKEGRSSVSGYVDFLARVTPRAESRSSILLP